MELIDIARRCVAGKCRGDTNTIAATPRGGRICRRAAAAMARRHVALSRRQRGEGHDINGAGVLVVWNAYDTFAYSSVNDWQHLQNIRVSELQIWDADRRFRDPTKHLDKTHAF